MQGILGITFLPTIPEVEAAGGEAIKIERFDQNIGADGSTFSLVNDVGATTSAFIRLTGGTRKTSGGPTGSTANIAPDVGTIGLVLSDTATVTAKRVSSTVVKVMGEVWRYEGAPGAGNEFIVRDRVAVTLSGVNQSVAIAGISNVNKVIPFVTGYTVNDTSVSNWNAATIAAHMDSAGNLVVSRNNSGTTATVYVDVVEFVGSNWNVCYGYSGAHDTTEETVTLNTASDGQSGATCDVTDWGTATIIEATMEGDSIETGLSDTLALVRPGVDTTSVVFDTLQDANARNDGKAWIHVLQNNDMQVNRASNADLAEGSGTYGTPATWPTGASTSTAMDLLGLEWFTDTSGVGTAHMRGGLNAKLAYGITYADGDLVTSADYDSTVEGNFYGVITFAATPTGVIYEAGGTGTGAFVGYNDAGDFIIRAGNGGSTAPADAARIVITTADYDFSGRTGTLKWNFYPATESVDVSFDDGSNGTIDYSTSTTAASAWANWSGGDDGYVGNSNGNIAGSEITSGYDFNGTIADLTFIQGSRNIQHWVHRSGNTVGVEYGVIDISALPAVTQDVFVTATGTHITETDLPNTNIYNGGTFILTERTSSRNVTSITLTESGTVDASQGLGNIKLFYDLDTTTPYDCVSESYAGTEAQFGSTDTNGFSGANGVSSFSDSVIISTTQTMCLYAVYDATATSTDGDTVQLSIANPSVDISVSAGGSVGPASEVAPTASTTLRNAEVTQTNYNWRNDDGSETTATSIEGTENTPTIGFTNGVTRRLRVGVSAEGSTSSTPIGYRLEYALKSSTCADATGWTDVGTGGGGDWDIINTANLTDGNDTTNVALQSNGGITDPVGGTFLTPNGGQKDTSSQTGNITLASGEFTELEYAIEPTVAAPQGNTYCFRVTDSGNELRNYTNYPEGTISADVDVTASSSQVTSLDVGSTGQYVGGTFVIERPGSTLTLTDITVTETGTVDAQSNLANPTLFYDLDTTAPYDCTGESYDGGETNVNGSAFSAPNGSSTFSGLGISIRNTQSFCGYIVFDVGTGATDGETVNIEITDPSNDVIVTGATVGPSTIVSPIGSTTIAGPVRTQTGFHWRNDDGSETGATSATLGVENTPLTEVAKLSTQRLRLQVSNEGAVTTQPSQYRLEYGTNITSCSNISTWTDVGAIGGAFDMVETVNLSDGSDTTDIAVSTGGITNANTAFVTSNGGQKDTSSQTGNITLTSTEFTEFEYAITPTVDAGDETNYCFRITDIGVPLESYQQYAELTTRPKQDFYIQRGSLDVTGTGATLVAGTDYVAPASTSLAFIRITNTANTGAGDTSAGGQQDADDVTAYFSNPANIGTSIDITRPSTAASSTRVNWEIIEYIGINGADNEMKVRDVGTVTYGATSLYATGTAVTDIADDNDVVVFITGQLNPYAGNGNYNDGISTAAWNATSSVPVFTRADADNIAAQLSYAVVEFSGANWKIQRVEHTYTATGIVETENISAVTSVNTTFVEAQKRVGNNLSGLDEFGAQVWLSSIGAVSFQLRLDATDAPSQTSVAWVIENTQTGTGAMTVYRSSGTIGSGGAEPESNIIGIGATIKTSNASLFLANDSSGGGTYYPRAILGARIISATEYELWNSDTGQNQDYQTKIVEWPIAEISIRQNYYRFYVDNDALDPTDPWPSGVDDLGENTSITGADNPLGEGERVRIRMSLLINNALLPQSTQSFKLQYGKRNTSCSAISVWNDLGDPSSGAIWRGYNATPIDGTELATSTPAAGTLNISVSDVAGTYEEQNSSAINPYAVDIGQDIEYDWLIEHNGATQLSDYCFRMVENDGTVLDGYNNYPTLRTTGYTPVVANWRWYDDATSTTPTSPLAGENTTPIDIVNGNEIKLRVIASEVEGAPGNNVKFKIQYSEYADFSTGVYDVAATSSCTATSTWCYADGAGVDNAIIDSAVLSDADSCIAGSGDGCGTYNEAATTTSTHSQPSLSNMEFEFTLKPAAPRANAVYYFRLYDVVNDVSVAASSSYPSVQIEGSSLVFSLSGLDTGTTTEGIVTDATTTPTAISLKNIPFDTPFEVAQRLTVMTNATEGYQILMYTDQDLTNQYGTTIPPITGTNANPLGWSTACASNAKACFGYHAGDDVLQGNDPRFGANDSYAAFSTTPQEVMYKSIPANESYDMVYKIQITPEQPSGDYQANITYIAIPVF